MKRCQKCSRTFPDETQKFCTFDGGLLRADEPAPPPFDPNLTVRATSKELEPPPGATASSEAPTSMSLRGMDETIASFGSSTYRETETAPTGVPTSSDLTMPVSSGSAPTSVDLGLSAQAAAVAARAESERLAAQPRTTSQPLVQPAGAAPQKKKSVLPWVILGVLVLLLFVGGGAAAAGYFLWLKPKMEAKSRRPVVIEREPTNENTNSNTNTNANTSENTNTNANATVTESPKSVEPFTPTAGATQFVNSKASLDGKLLEHYVEFSFYYPKSWIKDPKAGVAGASNFARLSDSSEEFAGENVAVSWYSSNGTYELDTAVFPDRAKILSGQFAKGLPNYVEVSQGETTINSLKGYEFRFKGVFKDTPKGDLPYWGRAIFVPPGDPSQKTGITILMLATTLAPGVNGPDDVGVKGELPLILESFRLGPSR
jgi:hypothetical protein